MTAPLTAEELAALREVVPAARPARRVVTRLDKAARALAEAVAWMMPRRVADTIVECLFCGTCWDAALHGGWRCAPTCKARRYREAKAAKKGRAR